MADEIKTNSAEVQQAVDQAMKEQKKKKKKKRLIIIAVIVVVIIAIGALASGGDDKPKTEPISGSSSQSVDSNDKENGVPDKIKPGTAITIDGLKISYMSCKANYTDPKGWSKPSKGKKIIRAEFTFENQNTYDISLNGFTCYADNDKCEEFYGPDDYNSPTLESVSAGRTFKSVVYYEVPSKAKYIELEFETDFWSDEKVIFVVE